MAAPRFGTLNRDVCNVIAEHCDIRDLDALSKVCKGGHAFFGTFLNKRHGAMLLQQHVLAGNAEAALKMIAAQPDLLFYKSPNNKLNVWQVLVATRDIPMIYDVLKLLPRRGVFKTLTKEGEKTRVALQKYFIMPASNLTDFIESCHPVIRTYDHLQIEQRVKFTFKKMGPTLAALPANALQYYCRPDKAFSASDFFEMTPPRELKYQDNRTDTLCDVLPVEKSGIGRDILLMTSSLFTTGYPQGTALATSTSDEFQIICEKMTEMDQVRTGQMLMLEQILNDRSVPVEKLKNKKAVMALLENNNKDAKKTARK